MEQHSGKVWVDMKIMKSQLKSIVKECLLEILAEGMGASTAVELNETIKKQQKSIKAQIPTRHQPTMASVLQQTASRTKLQPSTSNVEAIKETILREAGNNSVMVDILSDTAINTLPTMIESDRMKAHLQPAGTVERVVAAATPDQLFGEEMASKWAALAFADPIKK